MRALKKQKTHSHSFDYKNYEDLARFLNDRAKLSGRRRTTLSARDQKRLAQAVKRARHLGLLPFKPSI